MTINFCHVVLFFVMKMVRSIFVVQCKRFTINSYSGLCTNGLVIIRIVDLITNA